MRLARSSYLTGYDELSAKPGQDVEEVFEAITNLIMERKGKEGNIAPADST